MLNFPVNGCCRSFLILANTVSFSVLLCCIYFLEKRILTSAVQILQVVIVLLLPVNTELSIQPSLNHILVPDHARSSSNNVAGAFTTNNNNNGKIDPSTLANNNNAAATAHNVSGAASAAGVDAVVVAGSSGGDVTHSSVTPAATANGPTTTASNLGVSQQTASVSSA